MTTPQHIREAEEASAAFQLALARIGVETVEEALELWQGVNPARIAATAQRWLDQAVALIMSRRRQSRQLAMAYYRLVRALRTGRTVADPLEPSPRYVTLEVLRNEFAALAGEESDLPFQESESPGDGGTDDDPEQGIDEDRIPVDELDGLRAEEERLEDEAEEEARLVLDSLGTLNLERKLDDLDDEEPARDVDQRRDEAHDSAGNRQGSAAGRIARNGGRDLIEAAGELDDRILGYVRLSRTGTPCGWCAMLISRGPVYKSERSATRSWGDNHKYHDNCNCYAEPVFNREHYNNSPLFELNRRYSREWPRVTRGTGGRNALSAWRKYIRDQQG